MDSSDNSCDNSCDPCTICGDNFSEGATIKLKCNHEYHYECILESLKSKLNKTKGTIKVTERCCPYCRKIILYLPWKEGFGEPIKGIHNCKSVKTQQAIQQCNALTKSGKNVGQQCKNKCKLNGYCGVHKALS